jgi:hypothetical protein
VTRATFCDGSAISVSVRVIPGSPSMDANRLLSYPSVRGPAKGCVP